MTDLVDPIAAGERWDKALAACPTASFFHTSAWARTLAQAYGFRPMYYADQEGGEIRAALPLMEVSSFLTGRRGVGLPFSDECPPIGAGTAALKELHREALEQGRRRGWRYLECRGGCEAFDAPASASFLGHELALSGGEEALFAGLDGSTRRAIRKAQASDLQIEFSREDGAMREFHRLLRLTRQRHGVPPQPYRFFSSLRRNVLAPGRGWIVLARHQGKAVAGAVYGHFGQTVLYKYGASDMACQQLRANNLVMWEAIRRHSAEGFTHLDFGRTDPDNEGLRHFKLGWGATERRIDYVRQDVRSGAYLGASPAPAASGWPAHLFRRLPDPLQRAIGSALYRHAA